MKMKLIAAALAAAAMAAPAGAAQISAITNPDGVATFDSFDQALTSGPIDTPVTSAPGLMAPSVDFSATVDSTLGADIAELGANGIWGAGRLFAALGTARSPALPSLAISPASQLRKRAFSVRQCATHA